MGLIFFLNKKRTRYYYYLCFISLGGDCVSSFSLIVVGRILSKAAAICGSNLQMMMNGRRHSVGKEYLAVCRLKKKTDHKFLINRQPSCYRPCVVLVRRHLFSNQKLGGWWWAPRCWLPHHLREREEYHKSIFLLFLLFLRDLTRSTISLYPPWQFLFI